MEMAYREAKKEYNIAYARENTKQLKLILNTKTDADILEFLEIVGNKTGYIKQLIREDMKKREADNG